MPSGRRPETEDDYRIVRQSLMAERGITNQDLVVRWDVSPSFVSKLVSGLTRSTEREKELARLLGVEWGDIFLDVQERGTRDFIPL